MLRRTPVVFSLFALFAGGASAQKPTLVVENARVIVGDGTVLERGTIVISGERITSVGAEPVEASGARRIDAMGRTVLPGLIDTHVHLLMEHLFEQPRSDSAMQEFVRERLPARLRAYPEAGITTVMSAGDYWPFMEEVRARINAGELSGPRVYTAGPLVTAPQGHPAATFCGSLDINGPNPWCRAHLTTEVGTPSDARSAIARLSAEGADLIKFVYDGTDGPDVGVMEEEVVREIVDAATEHQLRTFGHILEMDKAITAIQSGLHGLVHLPAISTDPSEPARMVKLMQTKGVAAATTLTTFDSFIEIVAAQGDEDMKAAMTGLLNGMKQTLVSLAEIDAGLIALGTDSPHLPVAEAYHREVRLMGEAGLTPEAVIRAATRDAAAHMGLSAELGTLEAGKLADLIIVDGDPHSDITVLRNITAVVKGGEVVVSR